MITDAIDRLTALKAYNKELNNTCIKNECIICTEGNSNYYSLICSHVICVCDNCIGQINKKCPVCRGKINTCKKVFIV